MKRVAGGLFSAFGRWLAGLRAMLAISLLLLPMGAAGCSCGGSDSSSNGGLTGIVIDPPTANIPVATAVVFKAMELFKGNPVPVAPGDPKYVALKWTSADATIATVDDNGRTLALKPGSVKLTATDPVSKLSATADVTVITNAPKRVELSPATASVPKGLTQAFVATLINADDSRVDISQTAAWSTDNAALATVDATGVATGMAVGTATITAKEPASGLTATATLTVTDATLKSVEVTPPTKTIPKGTTQIFVATGKFSDGTTRDLTTTAEWSCSATTIATVTAGAAKGLVAGTTTITAKDTASGLSGSATLTVSDAILKSIAVTPPTKTLAKGATQAFTATATYTDNTTKDVTTTVTWSSNAAATATVNSVGVATAAAVGTTQIVATDSASSISGQATLTVTDALISSITVTPSLPVIAKGNTLPFTATATYSDSTTKDITTSVTWSSSDTNAATISNAAGTIGVATGAGPGTTTITAVDAASGKSGSTTLTVTTAQLVSMTLTPANDSLPVGLTSQYTATGTYSDGTNANLTDSVTWDSSVKSTATVSNAAGSQGLATALAEGSTVISASMPGTVVTATTTLTITAVQLQSIQIQPSNPSIAVGITQQFTATGLYSNGSNQDLTQQVTWGSSSTTVATISNAAGSQGLASSTNTGATTISATLGTVTASTTLTVTGKVLTQIQVTPANPTVALGLTQNFTAQGLYSDGSNADLTTQVTWSSSDASVQISNAAGTEGQAKAAQVGSATITASMPGTAISGSTLMTVSAAVLQSIQVTPANSSIAKGLTLQYTATGLYSDGSNTDLTTQVTWGSSAPAATISSAVGSEGLATAANAGATTISATLGAITGSTTLTVTAATLKSIDVTPSNPSIAKGQSMQFTATGVFTDNTNQNLTTQVTWSSSTANATISNAAGTEGFATGENVGASTISATLGAISGSTNLTVTAAVLTQIQVTPSNPTVALGLTQNFTAQGVYSDGSNADLTTQVTWSSNSGSAQISNATGTEGQAKAAVVGSATITATLGAINGSTTMTVSAAILQSIQVTPANNSIAKGLTLQYTATGLYSDGTNTDLTTQATWGSSAPTAASISNAAGSEGLATAENVGGTTISATLGAITGSTTLTVTAATLKSIDVTPSNPSIAKGQSVQLTATGVFTDNSNQNLTTQVTWSSSTANATVSNAAGTEGFATGENIGASTITATLGAISGATTLTVTAAVLTQIQINPTDPTVAKGLNQSFTATGVYSDASNADITTQVTWSSNNASVDISNAAGTEGVAKAVSVGSATITATLGAVASSTTMTVTSAVLQSIQVTPPGASLAKGVTQQYTATGIYSDTTNSDITSQVTWASSTSAVSISNALGTKGLASADNTGSSTISATLGAVSGSTNVTVTAATLTAIQLTPATPSLPNGQTLQFTATGIYTDNSNQNLTTQVTWESSTAHASISNAAGSEGLATAQSLGTSSISATLGAISGSTTLTVTAAVLTSIVIDQGDTNAAKGTSVPFTASGFFSDGSQSDVTTAATWTSSATSVATISNAAGSEGVASTKAVGDTAITAAIGGISSTAINLHVSAATLVAIDVTPINSSVAKGIPVQFIATGTYTDATTQDLTTAVTWASATPSVASISNAAGSEGAASTLAVGSSTISATLGAISGSTTLTVTAATLTKIVIDPVKPTTPTRSSEQFTATAIYSDNSSADVTATATWTSSNTNVATISNDHTAGTEGFASTTSTAGTTTISASFGGQSDSTLMTTVAATITSIVVTPTTPSVPKGATVQFTAIATYNIGLVRDVTQYVTWSSGTPSNVNIGNSPRKRGIATAKKVGTSTISATDTISGVSGSTVMTVNNSVLQSITITPANPTIPKNTKQQFHAIGNYSNGSTADITNVVTWGSSNLAVADISSNGQTDGLATTKTAGATTITATDPTTAIAGSTTLTVTNATLVSIAITPAGSSLFVGTKQSYTATATFSDASTKDVTAEVTWSTSNTGIASVSNSGVSKGVVTAVAAGAVNVIGAYPNTAISGSTGLTVTP